MISVRLDELVRLPAARGLWPAEFQQLVTAVEGEPADRTPLFALAGWLEENDEAILADACKWLADRPGVSLVSHQEMYSKNAPRTWQLGSLPQPLLEAARVHLQNAGHTSVASLMAALADFLRLVREAVA